MWVEGAVLGVETPGEAVHAMRDAGVGSPSAEA